MAKNKAASVSAPEAPEKDSGEVIISTVPETPETPETEATTSAAIDQPAVSDDASASSPSSADVVVEPAVESPLEPAVESSPSPAEEMKGGGGFNSPFTEPPAALTMIQRIEILEAKFAALEAK
jgi:hypothetical protein